MAIQKGDIYVVTTKEDNLMIRSGAGTNHSIIGRIPKGGRVKVANASKCTSTWLYITYSGVTGYSSKSYLTYQKDTKESIDSKNIKNSKKSKKNTKNNSSTNLDPKSIGNNKERIGPDGRYKSTHTASFSNNSGFSDLPGLYNQLQAEGLYSRKQIVNNRFNKFFRYGHIDPYYNISNTREYIFFTRPDLNIYNSSGLNPQLSKIPYFVEMYDRYKPVLSQLQNRNSEKGSNLCQLLTYHATGSIDVPSVSAKTVEGPQTIYGIGVDYRSDGRQSDFNYDFSIQFKDDKLLTCYRYFKTWEEYERLKKKGLVSPPAHAGRQYFYQENKILHDQIGIYKFVVGEDGREILYYAYYCGAFPTTVPRDSFNELSENPTYSIDWKCFKVMDMDPRILYNFNKISGIGRMDVLRDNNGLESLGLWNNEETEKNYIGRRTLSSTGHSDFTPVDIPFIYRSNDNNHISGYNYYLMWKVEDPGKAYKYAKEIEYE